MSRNSSAAASPKKLLEHLSALDRVSEKRRCEDSLLEFFARAWQEFDPSTVKINWHHEVIADHLEAVSRGEIRRLLINVPPRCSKTNLASIAYPAWTWAKARRRGRPLLGPQVRFMTLSYGAQLSLDIATTRRRLILGPWYQRHWGGDFQVYDDQASKENIGNSAGGQIIATSMKGATLGRGGDIRILDDPHSIDEAESDIERARVLRMYDEALATRETDPQNTAEIIIMQRLHERDLAGHIMQVAEDARSDDLVVLMLPMEYDPRRHCSTSWGEDPRVDEGELLWPEQFPRKILEERKRRLGPYAAAAQFQQAPVPRGGGIINRQWWRLWPDDYPEAAVLDPIYHCPLCHWHQVIAGEFSPTIECPACFSTAERHVPFPELAYKLLSVDTAYGEKQENSWSAATGWGIWYDKDDAPRTIMLEAWRGRPRLRGVPDSPDPKMRLGLVEQIKRMADGRQYDAILIEHKTRGTDLYQELERAVAEWPYQLIYFEPKGSKEIRLEATVPLFTTERVWAPDKAWAETVIGEVSSQPKAEFSDLADTVSAALLHLRNNGMLLMADEHRREKTREHMFVSGRFRQGNAIQQHYEGA